MIYQWFYKMNHLRMLKQRPTLIHVSESHAAQVGYPGRPGRPGRAGQAGHLRLANTQEAHPHIRRSSDVFYSGAHLTCHTAHRRSALSCCKWLTVYQWDGDITTGNSTGVLLDDVVRCCDLSLLEGNTDPSDQVHEVCARARSTPVQANTAPGSTEPLRGVTHSPSRLTRAAAGASPRCAAARGVRALPWCLWWPRGVPAGLEWPAAA